MVETERSMSLNIKNPDVEALVDEVAKLAGESKTEAVLDRFLTADMVALGIQQH